MCAQQTLHLYIRIYFLLFIHTLPTGWNIIKIRLQWPSQTMSRVRARVPTHTHTHTHTCLTALFLGLPRWAGTRKVKPIWILLKQETMASAAPYASLHSSRQIHIYKTYCFGSVHNDGKVVLPSRIQPFADHYLMAHRSWYASLLCEYSTTDHFWSNGACLISTIWNTATHKFADSAINCNTCNLSLFKPIFLTSTNQSQYIYDAY